MRTLLVICTALLLMIGFGADAQSQICFDFDPYCDGLELSQSGGQITGYWRNTDCAGTDVPVSGFIQSGLGYVQCYNASPPCPSGARWGFLIDGPLDGTMQMYQFSGGWNLWIDPLFYDYYAGECLFAPAPGYGPQQASWMLLDSNLE